MLSMRIGLIRILWIIFRIPRNLDLRVSPLASLLLALLALVYLLGGFFFLISELWFLDHLTDYFPTRGPSPAFPAHYCGR